MPVNIMSLDSHSKWHSMSFRASNYLKYNYPSRNLSELCCFVHYRAGITGGLNNEKTMEKGKTRKMVIYFYQLPITKFIMVTYLLFGPQKGLWLTSIVIN